MVFHETLPTSSSYLIKSPCILCGPISEGYHTIWNFSAILPRVFAHVARFPRATLPYSLFSRGSLPGCSFRSPISEGYPIICIFMIIAPPVIASVARFPRATLLRTLFTEVFPYTRYMLQGRLIYMHGYRPGRVELWCWSFKKICLFLKSNLCVCI